MAVVVSMLMEERNNLQPLHSVHTGNSQPTVASLSASAMVNVPLVALRSEFATRDGDSRAYPLRTVGLTSPYDRALQSDCTPCNLDHNPLLTLYSTWI